MIRFINLALLVGALLGFVGQGVAMAMSPNCAAAMARQPVKVQAARGMQMAGKMDCCPGEATGKHGSPPSKDPSSTCPMMAGCLAALAFSDLPVIAARAPIESSVTKWSLVTQFFGRSTAPEPPPPTI